MAVIQGSVTDIDAQRETAERQFRDLVATRSVALLRAGWLLTGDWASAEDLAQTALAATWTRWSRLDDPSAAEAYVRRVMLTTYLQWRRRRWTGEIATEHLPESADADAFGGVELRESLRTALGELTAQQRAVVVLRYFLDLSEADTAAALNCSRGSVKTHASRALARLRAHAGLAHLLDGDTR